MPLTILFLLLNILNNLEQLLGIWGGGRKFVLCFVAYSNEVSALPRAGPLLT